MTQRSIDVNWYIVTDQHVLAYFLLHKVPIRDSYLLDSGRVAFCFDPTPENEELVAQFAADQGLQRYVEAYRQGWRLITELKAQQRASRTRRG